MAAPRLMRMFAKWHLWLGWLVGLPILMWTVTGLLMVITPIENVRGTHLRLSDWERPLPSDTNIAVSLPSPSTAPVRAVSTQVELGEAVTRIIYMDGTSQRFRADGRQMGPLSEVEARLLVSQQIKGGDAVTGSARFAAADVPLDFRRPMDVWQITLEGGTRIYVGAETGRIEAVRTPWWRVFDTAWGLHIMDLETRQDTSHPVLILFAALSVLGALMGCILMFRRRRTTARPAA